MTFEADFARLLLAWYDREHRDLPFRQTKDPYAIWVSEIMLQQTQVKSVTPYFTRWMARFPTVTSLAQASEDEVLHAFQGLGYYSRARSLHRAAQQVVRDFGGRMPGTAHELRSLPGIGPYSAGAIASIAFRERVPAVDGNVVRVLTRLFAWHGDPQHNPLKAQLTARAAELVPPGRPGDFNQALMELGATVCTPRAPQCAACPVARMCRAQELGLQQRLPETAARPKPTDVAVAALALTRRGRVAVVKLRADAPRWAGMWQFPAMEVALPVTPAEGAARVARDVLRLKVASVRELGLIRHSVTRFRISLHAFTAPTLGVGELNPEHAQEVAWKRVSDLEEVAMPAAHRRIALLLLQQASGKDALPSVEP
ncbi:MAG TPA: A/G-specific adenine glycosylase [Polyangiaceae bacterium]|nr:A/G-specific adenine glycosylase [Polyangiaceae bacterium]